MPTSSSTSNVSIALNRRSSAQNAPVDERVLQQLEAHRPWELLDDMALAIIDQAYAAMIEFLGLDAPPEGGGPVKASLLVDPPDPDSPASPMILVVEASARHCCVRLIDGLEAAASGGSGTESTRRYVPLRLPTLQPHRGANRRANVRSYRGTVHLARADDAGDDGGQGADRWKKLAGDVRTDVSEKGLLGVLDAMGSHLDAAIRLEDRMISMARASGCRRLIKATDIIRVRMVLGHMRRQVDVDAVMSSRSRVRKLHCAWQGVIRRRRPASEMASEMDVDKVDESDVLTKKLKGLQHEGEESPTARRDLHLLEDHRPWEMMDNMALAIIDQTYTALLEILGHEVPPEGDCGHVTVSHLFDAADPGSPEPPPTLCVEASARHCRIYVVTGDDTGRESTTPRQKKSWSPRHRLTRASISASLGTLYLARVDGGGRGDYWRCADDDVRQDVAGKGLLGVLDAIQSRLDAAARLESRLLEIARAHRCRGPKVREIFRVRTALEDMRREVDIDVMVRRRRFAKRPRVILITYRPDEAEMDVDREDEAEVTKRLKALHV